MNDDAIFLTDRVGCIAGKPPPTKIPSRQWLTDFSERCTAHRSRNASARALSTGLSR